MADQSLPSMPVSTAEALSLVLDRGRRRRRRRALVVGTLPTTATVAILLIVFLVPVGMRPGTTRPASGVGDSGRGPTARLIYQVPNNAEDPAWAPAGGVGNDLWYWVPDGNSTIYEVSGASDSQRAYHLGRGPSCSLGCARAYPGLAVAPDGIVWGAVNDTLVRLDPTTGRFTTIPLPEPPPVVGEPGVDLPHGQNAVTVALGGPGGEIVIGFEFASALEMYTPGTDRVRTREIALPVGYFANDVAVLPDGTTGAVIQRFGTRPDPRIDLIAPTGSSKQVAVPDPQGVEADGADGFLVGESSPRLVTEAGRVEPAPFDFKLKSGMTWGVNGQDGAPNRLVLLPDHRVARPARSGFVAVATAHAVKLFPMPSERFRWMPPECGPARCSSTSTTTEPPSGWIIQRLNVDEVVVDGAGDLWILTSTPRSQNAFAEITTTQLQHP